MALLLRLKLSPLSRKVSSEYTPCYEKKDVDCHAGFNMGNDLAIFVTYAAHLVDGNLVTNLLSIGGKSNLTGPDPPVPASVAGLDTHAVFEGDASTTRGEYLLSRIA